MSGKIIRGIRDAIPSGFVIGRTDAGRGQPHLIKITDLQGRSPVSIQALLDSIGTTRGSILYRGASGWAIRTPGTSGKFLMSNGAGADPTYETVTQPAGANPTATAGDVAVNGAASTFMRSDAAPAVQKGSSSQFGIVKVDGTSIIEAAGVISAAGFVPLSAAFHPGYVTGRYYMSPFMSSPGTINLVANTLYACPFYVGATVTWTEIAVTVQTGAAGKSVRLGIYNNSGGQPTSLIVDAGSASVTGTGQITKTISQLLSPGWYWLAVVSDGTPTLRNLGATTGFNYIFGNTAPTDGVQVGLTASFTFGALSGADPFPTITYNANTTPLISLRK